MQVQQPVADAQGAYLQYAPLQYGQQAAPALVQPLTADFAAAPLAPQPAPQPALAVHQGQVGLIQASPAAFPQWQQQPAVGAAASPVQVQAVQIPATAGQSQASDPQTASAAAQLLASLQQLATAVSNVTAANVA